MTYHVAEAIAQNPDQKIGELTLLTEGEKRILHEWNDTTAAYATDELTIVSLSNRWNELPMPLPSFVAHAKSPARRNSMSVPTALHVH